MKEKCSCPSERIRICPFKEEIYNKEVECDCCDNCYSECLNDI